MEENLEQLQILQTMIDTLSYDCSNISISYSDRIININGEYLNSPDIIEAIKSTLQIKINNIINNV